MILRVSIVLATFALVVSSDKNFTLCEFALEVYTKHQVSYLELVKHVCIAGMQSKFQISKTMSGDQHGIYKFNQPWWCGVDMPSGSCNTTCDKFHDDDISDDIECATFAFRTEKGLQHWRVDESDCQGYFDKISVCVPLWQREWNSSR